MLHKQGKYAEAKTIMNRHTLSLKEEVHVETHQSTVTVVIHLASLIRNKREYEAASILYQRACIGHELCKQFT